MQQNEQAVLRKALEDAMDSEHWQVNAEGGIWRLQSRTDDRAIGLPIHDLEAQLDRVERKEDRLATILAFAERVTKALPATEQSIDLHKQQGQLYPILRSAAFAEGSGDGPRLVSREHTAESSVFYAIDFGDAYALVNETMLRDDQISADDIHNWALANLKKLSNEPKMDFVAGNQYYFFSGDHYAASRILNRTLMRDMQKKIKGEMAAAIPHQDVLILADLHNEAGYNVLGQMAMSFYGKGDVPITPLPMAVEEQLDLTPMLILPDAIKQKKTFK